MSKKKPAAPREQAAAPALAAALDLMVERTQQHMLALLQREHAALRLPAEARFDLQRRVWIIPE